MWLDDSLSKPLAEELYKVLKKWVDSTKWNEAFKDSGYKFKRNNQIPEEIKSNFTQDSLNKLAKKYREKSALLLEDDLLQYFYSIFSKVESKEDAADDAKRLVNQIIDGITNIKNRELVRDLIFARWHQDLSSKINKVDDNVQAIYEATVVESKNAEGDDNYKKLALYSLSNINSPGFNAYYFGEPGYVINEDSFVLYNYEIVIMNEECSNIKQSRTNASSINSLNDITRLIESQDITLITGLYGTGKTALLKRLFQFYENIETVYFFHANDIIRYIEEYWARNDSSKTNNPFSVLDDFFERIRDNRAYVFVDELEEMNKHFHEDISHDKSEQKLLLEYFFDYIFNRRKLVGIPKLIIASRLYTVENLHANKYQETYIADVLFETYYINEVSTIRIIRAKEWTSVNRKKSAEVIGNGRHQWFEYYAKLHQRTVSLSDIKNNYGKIFGKLNLPIFMYAFMSKYFEINTSDQKTDPNTLHGYYFYYKNFINKTVDGKYGKAQRSHVLDGYGKDEFTDLIQFIAFVILKENKDYVDRRAFTKKIVYDEQPILDDSLVNINFEISLDDLDKALNTNAGYRQRFDFNTSIKTINLINCYFLKIDNTRIFFTDTNILFCLAAEYIYKSIESAANRYNLIFAPAHLKEIALVSFYPQLIDYVVYLYLSKESGKARGERKISQYLESFVTNQNISNYHIDLQEDGDLKIKKILLLYILFIKGFERDYKKKYSHTIKDLFHYVTAYKTSLYQRQSIEPRFSDIAYEYTVDRYFMNITVNKAQLNRINFKHFNFQGSMINETKFQQCKFYQTNMRNVVLENTEFRLCEFDDVGNEIKDAFKLVRKEGHKSELYQAHFIDCTINDSNLGMSAASFERCLFRNVDIKLDGNCTHRIEMNNCIVEKLRIFTTKSSAKPRLKTTNCSYLNRDSLEIDNYEDWQVERIIESSSFDSEELG